MSELIVLVVVALVVIGPKDLPKVLKKLGYWAGRLRRMAGDLRAQSGIDDVLHNEGLHESIVEIRKLARGEIESVKRSVDISGAADADVPRLAAAGAGVAAVAGGALSGLEDLRIDRDREYPRDGADGYSCLPDTAIVYDGTIPYSALDRDAFYVLGDRAQVLPPREDPHAESASEGGDAAASDGDAASGGDAASDGDAASESGASGGDAPASEGGAAAVASDAATAEASPALAGGDAPASEGDAAAKPEPDGAPAAEAPPKADPKAAASETAAGEP